MANWIFNKELIFKRNMPPFDYKGELFSACGTEWEITLDYIPFFDVKIKCEYLEKPVFIKVRASDARYYSISPFEQSKELCFEFTPDQKQFRFRFNLHYRDCSDIKVGQVDQPNVQVKIQFYTRLDVSFDEIIMNLTNTENVVNDPPQEESSDSDTQGFSDNLTANYKQLLVSGDFADVIIHCDGEDFRAHKAILAARSPVFAAMFRSSMKEAQSDEIDIEEIKPNILRAVLLYIYCGEFDLVSGPVTTVCAILAAADKYMLSGLKELCIDILKSSVTVDNALDILVLADLYDKDLRKDVLKFICFKYNHIKDSPEWINLQTHNPSLIIDIMTAKILVLEKL